ncbi:HNH endonuclease [Listeria welshimeri]|nr:HNH endonuclease [Listeria welshimeri]
MSGFVRQEVELKGFTTRTRDFREADKISPKRPDGTWYHHEDGKTLQEVETRIHSRFTHRGGFSLKNK